MRDFDFDVDLFTTDPIDTISTDLPLCKTDIDFESKLVDEICNETSSRHSPISADSGNHSPSSTSSEVRTFHAIIFSDLFFRLIN